MVAAPFTETLIFKGQNGKTLHYRMTVSDVAAASALASDGQGQIQLPADQNYSLIDAIVVVGGTDTTQQEIFVNGLSAGVYVDNKSNLNTANFRQFIQAPLTFRGGSVLRFKQLA